MPTNEAGLSGGHDQGHGGNTPASDMPGGEGNMGPGRDAQSPAQPTADKAQDAETNGDPQTATGPGD